VSKASPEIEIAGCKRKGELTEGIPGFCIHRRIDDRQRELPGCRGLTRWNRFSTRSRRMRTADIIDPGSCIEPKRLDGRTWYPSSTADRVAVPSWL